MMNTNELKQLRHELHKIAELSGNETVTSARIETLLKSMAPDDLITGIGGYGIAAVFKGKFEGPSIGFRAELDAVPVEDVIERDYVSENEGVGHKCGHDGHMAVLLGLASLLSEKRDELQGSVMILFQPSEENGKGADAVVRSGLFDTHPVDILYAFHNLPGFEKHSVIIKDGVFTAASRGLTAVLKGQTAHAGHPEDGISPVPALAELMTQLPKIPQSLNSDSRSLITVVHASVGEKTFGTAPGEGVIMATLRGYSNIDMEQLSERSLSLIKKTTESYRLKHTIEWDDNFEAVVNDSAAVANIRCAADTLAFKIIERDSPFPWSEDFGVFSKVTATGFFGLGSGVDHPQLHHKLYDFPDQIIQTGIDIFINLLNFRKD